MLSTDAPIAVVAAEAISSRMAGPAIRAWEIARVLTRIGNVALVAPKVELSATGVSAHTLGTPEARRALRRARVVVGQGFNLRLMEIVRLSGALVVDAYDPLSIELLEHFRFAPADGWEQAKVEAIQRILLARGDFFLCASERQRAFWLGALLHQGRLTQAAYALDPSLRSLIDVVPFGIPDDPPQGRGPGLRALFPGIGPDDPVLLWNGGIWNWLDPVTAIRGVAEAVRTRPDLRLVFLGTRLPRSDARPSRAAEAALEAATELGLLNRHVFFHPEWVPYEERASLLLDATAGICLHLDTPEAALSFRTRLLDCLWTGLPILCSAGDFFADLVETHDLGRVVPSSAPEAVARAMLDLASPQAQQRCRSAMARVAGRFAWSQTTQPLARFCERAMVTPPARRRAWGPVAEFAAAMSLSSLRHSRWMRLPRYLRREIEALLR